MTHSDWVRTEKDSEHFKVKRKSKSSSGLDLTDGRSISMKFRPVFSQSDKLQSRRIEWKYSGVKRLTKSQSQRKDQYKSEGDGGLGRRAF